MNTWNTTEIYCKTCNDYPDACRFAKSISQKYGVYTSVKGSDVFIIAPYSKISHTSKHYHLWALIEKIKGTWSQEDEEAYQMMGSDKETYRSRREFEEEKRREYEMSDEQYYLKLLKKYTF